MRCGVHAEGALGGTLNEKGRPFAPLSAVGDLLLHSKGHVQRGLSQPHGKIEPVKSTPAGRDANPSVFGHGPKG